MDSFLALSFANVNRIQVTKVNNKNNQLFTNENKKQYKLLQLYTICNLFLLNI